MLNGKGLAVLAYKTQDVGIFSKAKNVGFVHERGAHYWRNFTC
jgi:hypothetical protein